MSRRAEGSTRIAAAGVFAVLVIVALLAGSPASQAGKGASCKGPSSIGSFFELGKGGKVATRRTSCGKGKAVAKGFGRSCAKAYTAQGKCRVRAGGKWRCRSRMIGGVENGAPARVKCRKRKGRVSFVVGWFPPVEPSLDPAPAGAAASGAVARAPSPAWNASSNCIAAATPGMDVDPPAAGANFRIRVISKLATSLEFGKILQQSLLDHNVWNQLHAGLDSFPRNEPGRFPIILSRGTLPDNAYGVMQWNCSDDSTDAILIRGSATEELVNETGAHELFHAFSRGRGAALNPDWQRTWWEEASAEWFQGKAGYGEDTLYDNELQYPNVALDHTPETDPKTYAYAMSRFIQFLDDQGYVTSGTGWPLQKLVIDGYPAATETLDQVLKAQGTTLGKEAAAFWGDRIKKQPSHGPALQVGADGTKLQEIGPGSETITMSAERLHTKLIKFFLQGNVSRVELEFHPDPGSYFWARTEPNVSVPVADGTTLAFCANGEGTGGEMKWPEPPDSLPVTFTNGNLSEGTLKGEIEVRAQQDSLECGSDSVPSNRACRILADANVADIFGSGTYPFYTTMDGNPTVWLCFYEGQGTEVSFRLAHYSNTTTKQVRDTVKKQINSLGLEKINVGDLAGIGTQMVEGKLATIMTIASGREIIFLIVGPGGKNGTIQLGKRIVGQID
jgi:hypothetical protein